MTRRPFAPLERATITDRVRDVLQVRITSGELQPGRTLPAERALADEFGVARTSVREAIQGLIALGLIERRGNRSYVVEQVPGSELPASDGGKRSQRSLVEAWRVLEVSLFELACVRATARERRDTADLAHRVPPTTVEEFAVLDREFHGGIAAACGNPALTEVHGRVIDNLLATEGAVQLIIGAEGGAAPVRAAIRRACEEHRAVADAYLAGEVAAMLDAVDHHLGQVADRVTRSTRRLIPGEGRMGPAAGRTVGL